MFKVDNKDIKATSLMLFGAFISDFKHCSGIVNFEQLITAQLFTASY